MQIASAGQAYAELERWCGDHKGAWYSVCSPSVEDNCYCTDIWIPPEYLKEPFKTTSKGYEAHCFGNDVTLQLSVKAALEHADRMVTA